MSITLWDVIKELRARGEAADAEACELFIPLELGMIHGFTPEKVLGMTMEEVEAWYNTPPKPARYDGWQFWRGREA